MPATLPGMTVLDVALSIVAIAVFVALMRPAVRRSEGWSATVTPLASIMGSGFLISGPLLASVVGVWMPLAMLALLAIAYGIGGAIRFNIRELEPAIDSTDGDDAGGDAPNSDAPNSNHTDSDAPNSGRPNRIEHRLHQSHRSAAIAGPVRLLGQASRFVLAAAYVVSVTYYIMLLCQFALQPAGLAGGAWPSVVATTILGSIAAVGVLFGLSMIERVERTVISANLAIIAATIVGLAWFNVSKWSDGSWSLPALEPLGDTWTMVRMLLGLLIVVQGFETSRFLGSEFDADLRIRSMRWAQAIAATIYVVFLSLLLVAIEPDQATADAGVTTILKVVAPVAGVLPILLTVAAVGSQFSAAVADTAGCGGLLERLIGPLSARMSYLAIGTLTIALAWVVDVRQIIGYASRAFAVFYAIQCAMAATHAWRTGRRPLAVGFATLAAVAALVAVVGKSSE